MERTVVRVALVVVALAVSACSGDDSGAAREHATTPSTTQGTTTSSKPAPTTTTVDPSGAANPRPAWLGTRPLPLRPDGFGEIRPTPSALVDRRLDTPDELPPPPDDTFRSTIVAVPDDVAARSTWSPECPVALDDLRYVTLTFLGFDGDAHTGELLVNASVADDVVHVFEQLYAARFPIEEMRIVRQDELDAPPTGDGNDTGAFACRPVTGGSGWSEHAYGLAVDVNPFHNPYVRDDVVVPELASAYVDRSDVRAGMIVRGDAVTSAFAGIGWGWGGDFQTLTDPMHFSATGD